MRVRGKTVMFAGGEWWWECWLLGFAWHEGASMHGLRDEQGAKVSFVCFICLVLIDPHTLTPTSLHTTLTTSTLSTIPIPPSKRSAALLE